VVALKIKSNTPEIGTLDETKNQKFYCSPAYDADEDLTEIMNY